MKTAQSKDLQVGMVIHNLPLPPAITMRVERLDEEEDSVYCSFVSGNEKYYTRSNEESRLYIFFYKDPTFQTDWGVVDDEEDKLPF